MKFIIVNNLFIFFGFMFSYGQSKDLIKCSPVNEIQLNNYFLYEIELKNKSEDYYGLVISKKNYKRISLKKIIRSCDYYLVNKVSFYTYFNLKKESSSIEDYEECPYKLDYKESFIKAFETKKAVINILKISGKFKYRKTFSNMYNSYSNVNLNIDKSKEINVIYPICDISPDGPSVK